MATLTVANVSATSIQILGDDVATRAYVQNFVTAIAPKGLVRVATTAALDAVTATATTLTADANGILAAIDGVTLVVNDRLIVKDQVALAQNGIYVVTDIGSAGTPFILTRSLDCDGVDNGSVSDQVNGAYAFCAEGTENTRDAFIGIIGTAGIIGTTDYIWEKFTVHADDIPIAGDGLAQVGASFNVDLTHDFLWTGDHSFTAPTFGVAAATTNINASGTAAVTVIGNDASGALSLTGSTVALKGVTGTSINTSGTGTTIIGNGTGAISVTGPTTVLGTTVINGTGTSTTTIGHTGGGAISLTGVTTLTGVSNINSTASDGATVIGNSADNLSLKGLTTTIEGTTDINVTGTSVTTIGSGNGTVNILGTTTVTGATVVNTGAGEGPTTIGNSTALLTLKGSTASIESGVAVNINTIGTSPTTLGNATGALILTGATTTILGTTNINTTNDKATSIGNATGGVTLTGADLVKKVTYEVMQDPTTGTAIARKFVSTLVVNGPTTAETAHTLTGSTLNTIVMFEIDAVAVDNNAPATFKSVKILGAMHTGVSLTETTTWEHGTADMFLTVERLGNDLFVKVRSSSVRSTTWSLSGTFTSSVPTPDP